MPTNAYYYMNYNDGFLNTNMYIQIIIIDNRFNGFNGVIIISDFLIISIYQQYN